MIDAALEPLHVAPMIIRIDRGSWVIASAESLVDDNSVEAVRTLTDDQDHRYHAASEQG